MLKALELAGFKSFADRTRFDFDDGITVVVGPNGSGKSNIVDAIKWVLGSQSAKGLRGGEMADVIFKGSAAGGRKPANSAEVSLLLDNSHGRLGIDSPEVQVTRRLYRSGEGEYLINGQAVRLRDVRDLFRGTGVGIDAYSLIEQGKVDRMLQSSAKDRRAIFEEAAGVSRFKAKRTEALRRLQRVDQALVRLRDIVSEVGTRLETLKSQATKAQRYREATREAEQLRTQLAVTEQAELRGQLQSQQQHLVELNTARQQFAEAMTQAATQVERTQLLAQQLAAQHRQQNDQLQQQRQQQAVLEQQAHDLAERQTELQTAGEELQQRLTLLVRRAELTEEEVQKQADQVSVVDRLQHDHLSRIELLKQELAELNRQLVSARQAHAVVVEQQKGYHTSAIQSEQQSQLLTKQLDQLANSRQLRQTALDQLEQEIEQGSQQTRVAEQEHLAAVEHERLATERLAEATEQLELARSVADRLQHELAQLQASYQGARERQAVLEMLQRQHSGVASGAVELLARAQKRPQAPWNSVLGMVADLVEIDVHLAPLIDVALGPAAETVVVADGQLMELARDGQLSLEGRLSLVRLDRLPARRPGHRIQLDGLRGVLGRADRLVYTQDRFTPLMAHLLGTTWLVDTLATAMELSHLRGAGLRFVTASCELIEIDGSLSLGSLQAAPGLVSRRSEHAAAAQETERLDRAREQAAHTLARHQHQLSQLNEQLQLRQQELQAAARRSSQLLGQLESRQQLQTQLLQQKTLGHQELENLDRQRAEAEQQRAQTEAERAQLQRQAEALEDQRLTTEQQVERLLGLREAQQQQVIDQQLQLARLEQQTESLQGSLSQLEQARLERQQAIEQSQAELARLEQRIEDLLQQQTINRQRRAELDNQQQTHQSNLDALTSSLKQAQTEWEAADQHAEQLGQQLREAESQHEKTALNLQQLKHQLEGLQQRALREHNIDLSDPELESNFPILNQPQAAEQRLSRLRQEIQSIGSVNMEALQELDTLQSRFDTLDGQYRDLVESKDRLLKLISKIDQDSQRMFLETLEIIRQNFQLLYRKSFGGGQADLVLQPGTDGEEPGVEIIATPPGKTTFSNSLLSGGEKALTAVALIMAIFQYRPSPFCVLDEVDAPFDEANIGRFVNVLKEFLASTRFIVVTHSKKTMTAADRLYGVTMQESGVSTRVGVRFEDVDEHGNILAPGSNSRAA
jgi:chromosome segregation protein